MAYVAFNAPEEMAEGYKVAMPVGILSATAPEFCKFSVAAGCSTIDDFHDEHEIWFVVSGGGVITLDGVNQPLVKGDTIYFKPMAHHKLHNTGDAQIDIFSFWWLELT